MTKTKFLVVGGFAAIVGVAGLVPLGARADDADLRAVNNRLDRIERAVNDMQQNYSGGAPVSSGGGSSGGGSADMQLRLSEIEEQMRSLTGRIEELSHRVDQTSQDLQTYKQATDLRFQDMQSGAPAPGGAPTSIAPAGQAAAGPGNAEQSAPAAKPAAAPSVTLPAGTAQVQYDFAIDLLKRGQFPQARDAFTQFLQQHPKDPLAGNAQYWLGETYYVQGQYKDAADSFLKGYTTYSKSSKAPDSLLKLGMTLSALGQKDAACATFGQLKEQFPQASPAVVARNKQERQKAGC